MRLIDADRGWPLGKQDFKPSQPIYEKVNGNGLLTVTVYDGDVLQIILTGHPSLNVNEDIIGENCDKALKSLLPPRNRGKH
jgi:hypothetical protein